MQVLDLVTKLYEREFGRKEEPAPQPAKGDDSKKKHFDSKEDDDILDSIPTLKDKQPDFDESKEDMELEINDQFKMLYQGDPELRKVLGKSNPDTFTVQEKYQIIEAYMAGGGAQGL